MEIKTEIKTIEYIEYDGIKFYRDNKGYWLSSKCHGISKSKRLHVYVWEKYNGAVPKGYHVHHIDHDTDNNDIENLQLIEKFKHLQYHARLQDKKWLKQNLDENARPKAVEWHKSEEGREWHRKHYEEMKDKLYTTVHIKCAECGKETEAGISGAGNKFCSNKCKTMHRRKSGIDNILQKCEICGKEYNTNKYNPARYCSKECRVRGRYESKKD